MIKTINKANWTGQEAKIKINEKKNTVSLYGVCGSAKWEVFKINIETTDDLIYFSVTNDNWDSDLFGGYFDNKIQKWIASETERYGKCIYTVVAQVLYTIL